MSGANDIAVASRGHRRDPRNFIGPHAIALVGAVAWIVLGASADHWDLDLLVIVAGLASISDLIAVQTGSTRLKISGSHHGIMIAAVLLGGGPAAAVAVFTILVGWLRWREAGHYLRNNLVVFACFPLIGGRFFHAAVTLGGYGNRSAPYYLLVFVTFMLSLGLNFVGIAGYQSYLDGIPLRQKARETILPLLGAELFSSVLTMATVYIAVVLGKLGLLLFGIVLLVFQYLVGELLKSKQRSEELHRLATRDDLTGLANRESFREGLTARIAAAGPEEAFAVMLMDLDHFKEVNDTLGHHYGDLLLRQLGQRLASQLREGSLVARLGGDEFALLAPARSAEVHELEAVATALLGSLQQAFSFDELSIEVGASIGIARFPHDGRDASTLMRRADAAMYSAKEKQSGYELYSRVHDVRSARRLTVLSDFRRGLADGEIVVHYQPVVALKGLHLRGAEGLVRWRHPELGLLPPTSFVQTVERTSLIGRMTRHVLEQAIRQCAAWTASGVELSVAVNLSVRNLLDRELVAETEELLTRFGVRPSALKLEITESMLMSDPDRAWHTVIGLSDLGVRISVDDFGTGYSSLASLRDLPIDELKIDRSFVTPMLRDESDLIIVRSTINLAHDLGLRAVAEGVEDALTLRRLAQLGCDLAQGFHISQPLPAEQFAKLMRAGNPGVAA